MMKRIFVIHTKSQLQVDLCDNVMQCQSTFLDLLNFVIGKFLIEDGIDSILTNDHWQTQKHLMIYTVIALHQQSVCSLSFCPAYKHEAKKTTRPVHYNKVRQSRTLVLLCYCFQILCN